MTFIDAHRGTYGVEPICEVLPIAPATYFRHKTEQAHPARRSERAQRDDWLTTQIQQVWDENFGVYGARKVSSGHGRASSAVDRLLLERAIPALDDPVGFRLFEEAEAGVDAPVADLVEEVV